MGEASSDLRLKGAWYRLRGSFPRDGEDLAVGAVDEAGGRGAWTRPAGPGRIEVIAWFDAPGGAEACRTAWTRAFGAHLADVGIARETDPGWLEASLGPRPPIRAGRFVVTASREDAAPAELVRIVIPPGLAFGTGEHATTKLCLRALSDHLVPGMRVLDVGTGSGILAIAAARADARRVVGIDRDPEAIAVAQANAARNEGSGAIRFVHGSWNVLAGEEPFDLIVANVHRTAVCRGAGPLGRRLVGGGIAILSGFLVDDIERVAGAWRAACAPPIDVRTKGEWAAVIARRDAPGGEGRDPT